MDEKKKVLLIFAVLAIVAIVGLVLLFKSEKTGEFNVQLPVNIKPAKTTRQVPVRAMRQEMPVSREPLADVEQIIIKTKSSFIGNSCLWADKGMLFHISPGVVKHMDFDPSKTNKYEYFNKNDLEFNVLPDFYNFNDIYVKGGTIETYNTGARLCIKTYKGQKIIPQAGLSCIENRWWLIANICPLGAPTQGPPMPD